MYSENFFNQVQLLLQCMPAIRDQDLFALKGGTAINLFLHDLPRLSIDIDLTYRHIDDRETSLINTRDGLKTIGKMIKGFNSRFKIVEQISKKGGNLVRLFVYGENSMIKIEPNFIGRGTVHPIVYANLCKQVNSQFDAFLDKIPMVSPADLYAGKICAALNRQHPRDLFDIKILFETTGITDEIRQAFVIYLAGDSRPMNELLAPNRLDITQLFQKDFLRMTNQVITLDELLSVREKLIAKVNQMLTDADRQFLLSIKKGKPEFDLIPIDHIDQLPAIRWKLINVNKMDQEKQKLMLSKLSAVLES